MTNLTSNPLNTTVQQDNNLTLLCITNANPPATYYFYFNQSFIGKSNSGEFNVTVEGDGMYTCVPINNVGTGNNATLNVTTVGEIPCVFYGTVVNVSCWIVCFI